MQGVEPSIRWIWSILSTRSITSIFCPLRLFFGKKKASVVFTTEAYKIKNLAATYSPTLLCAVPSAMRGLTSEFGMGSGISLSLMPPSKILAIESHQVIFTNIKRRLKLFFIQLTACILVFCDHAFKVFEGIGLHPSSSKKRWSSQWTD